MYWHTYSNFIKGETIIKSIDITIQDKEGLHARPDGILSKATMTKNSKAADMKKIFAVMGLAVKCSETVTIAADGADEDAAIEELTRRCHPENYCPGYSDL